MSSGQAALETAMLWISDLLPLACLMLVAVSAVVLCRERLRRFTTGIWTSGQMAGPTSAHQNPRAGTSSPEIEVALDRDSDDSSGDANEDRAQQSSPGAISHKLAPMLAHQDSCTQAQGHSSCPEGHSPEVNSCSFAAHQMQSTAKRNGPALPLNDSTETSPQMDEHTTAPATAPAGAAALAAAHQPCEGDHQAAEHSAVKIYSRRGSCQPRAPVTRADASSPGACILHTVTLAHGEASVATEHTQAAHAVESSNKRAASASASQAMLTMTQDSLSGRGHQIVHGKRKRGRKSVQRLPQQAMSVQQSNAAGPESAKSAPDNKDLIFVDDGARDCSSYKAPSDPDVIDLTLSDG